MRFFFSFPTVIFVLMVAFTNSPQAGEKKGNDKFELSKEEKLILELTNKERAKENLPPLEPNPLLFKVARAHSQNMAKQGKLEHDLDGKSAFQRIKAAGYQYRAAGENVAYGNFSIPRLFKGWMDSEGHRKNILNQNFTEIGLGHATTESGFTYYTQVFAKPWKNK